MTILHFNFQTYHFPGNCPTDDFRYKWISERCYFLEMERKNYGEAEANCPTKFSNGGKLFEPMSLQVSELVWEAFKDTILTGYGPWIGVNDKGNPSVYKYTSSGSKVSFAIPFNYKYYNANSSKECIYMWKPAKWNEAFCTTDQPSICEEVGETTENPTTITENPTTIPENPTTFTENPTTINENPTTKPENPTTFTENPTTIADNPTTISASNQSASKFSIIHKQVFSLLNSCRE